MKRYRGKDLSPRKPRSDGLSSEVIAAIRSRRADGVRIKVLVVEFGVSKQTILKYTRDIAPPNNAKSWYSYSADGPAVTPSLIIDQGDGTAHVALNKGRVAIIDFEDIPKVSGHRWFSKKADKESSVTFYARAENQRIGAVFMHNIILPTELGHMPDHINRNGLDNRKANLRPASRSGNNANRSPAKTMSGFIGVTFYKPTGRWNAHVAWRRKHYSAGYFSDPVDAARARDVLARSLQGEFAVLNFPEVSS